MLRVVNVLHRDPIELYNLDIKPTISRTKLRFSFPNNII